MNTTRRSFIKNSTVIIAGAALLPHHSSTAAGKKLETLAIQLYPFENEMFHDAKGTLTDLGKMGYKYVEHANYTERTFYGYSPADFRKLLDDCGLTLLSGHTVLEMKHWNKPARHFIRDWHYTIEDAATAGQQYLITPWIDRSIWNNEHSFRYFMDVFNKSGELCKRAGLQFGYHNHDFEFTHTLNSVRLYDIILQHTCRDLVFQQLDIANLYQKGYSVNDLFSRYPGRFQLMHVKDLVESNDRHHPYKTVPLGQGYLNISNSIEKGRQKGGTICFIIDQHKDISSDSIVCARESCNYFNRERSSASTPT